MAHRKTKLLAVAATVLLFAAACGSSPKTGTGGGQTITVGVLTDYTGLGASGNKATVSGVQAGVAYAARNGYTLKYIIGDTATSPATALAAAQKLVQQDHVLAVIANSALTFAAANYLKSQNIPVIGSSQDGDEWATDLNMFPINGAVHTSRATTTDGTFFKMLGVTNLASVGYNISPRSAQGAKAAAASAQKAGIKVGYLNSQFPFGSTNVQPAALAMQAAGVDGLTTAVDANTSFAFVTALRQLGVKLKVALFPVGYGADLYQAGPNALQEAQNVYFFMGQEPMEVNSASTRQFAKDLKTAGIVGDPAESAYNGYLSVGLLVRGLQKAGSHPTQASLINALAQIHDWDSMGLWGGRKMDINDRVHITAGVDNCIWVVKLVGSTFQLVPGAEPVCGTDIPGVTIPAS